ncbi:MAG: N-acetyl-gamma-glutamyl-phosphate reductase [Oscillospiraceae bacterium]|nr:N-acetyl-gamma-glutamyl-phosphate reductase [Oscillospiraceae bacterium]
MTKVFIDGSAGTTGLRIYERLSGRGDIALLRLTEGERKSPEARREALQSAELAFLCLPDDAAREAVALAGDSPVRIIDTSTAHRTAPDWVYGFPELKGRREQIRSARRVANPGCHASGFIALVAPLVGEGLLPRDALLSCFSLTGYSGGGKKMIAEYESAPSPLLSAPRQYGLGQSHKHLPEMARECALEKAPVFCPIVAPYYAGMEVTVPLFREMLRGGAEQIKALYRDYYAGGLVRFREDPGEGGFLSACACAGWDGMELSVHGNGDRILLAARFDNLGKGASGAAIQNMNLMLGMEETEGLNIQGDNCSEPFGF